MEEEWIKLKNIFEASELGLPNQYINFLKGALMTESDLLFLQATRTLFSLMQSLGSVKNAFAPLIYKILISGFSTFNDISKVPRFLFRLFLCLIISLKAIEEFQVFLEQCSCSHCLITYRAIENGRSSNWPACLYKKRE